MNSHENPGSWKLGANISLNFAVYQTKKDARLPKGFMFQDRQKRGSSFVEMKNCPGFLICKQNLFRLKECDLSKISVQSRKARPQPLDTLKPRVLGGSLGSLPATFQGCGNCKEAGKPIHRHKRHTEAKRRTESYKRWSWRR